MRKTANRLFSAFFALCLFIAFSACTPQGDDMIVIEYMHFHTDADSEIKKIANDFFRETGIKVNVNNMPVVTYLTSLNSRIQTNSTPELFAMWPGATIPPYIESNVLASLDDIESEWKNNMTDISRAACTYNGTLYLAPLNNEFMAIGYNKDVFNRLNISPPENMEQFENLLETLKADSQITYPMIWGSDAVIQAQYMLQLSYIYQNTPDWNQQINEGTAFFNSQENKAVFRKLFIEWPSKSYYNADSVSGTDRMTKAAIEFLDGRSALFMYLGSWDLNVLDDLNEENTNIGMFPFPGEENKGTALSATGAAIGINDNMSSARKNASLQFLEYYLNAESNAKVCAALNSLSAYKDVNIEANPIIAEFQHYIDSTARGWCDWPQAVQNISSESLDIITKLGSKKDDFAAAENALNNFLDKMQQYWILSLQ